MLGGSKSGCRSASSIGSKAGKSSVGKSGPGSSVARHSSSGVIKKKKPAQPSPSELDSLLEEVDATPAAASASGCKLSVVRPKKKPSSSGLGSTKKLWLAIAAGVVLILLVAAASWIGYYVLIDWESIGR